MYLTNGRAGYRGLQQVAMRAPFLLLLQTDAKPFDEVYAVVRKVALSQLGNFMMGRANLCGRRCTVSGSYGSDGLPMTVKTLPRDAVRLPAHLYEMWNKGGGWNGAGSEASAMRAWAKETFKV